MVSLYVSVSGWVTRDYRSTIQCDIREAPVRENDSVMSAKGEGGGVFTSVVHENYCVSCEPELLKNRDVGFGVSGVSKVSSSHVCSFDEHVCRKSFVVSCAQTQWVEQRGLALVQDYWGGVQKELGGV